MTLNRASVVAECLEETISRLPASPNEDQIDFAREKITQKIKMALLQEAGGAVGIVNKDDANEISAFVESEPIQETITSELALAA